MKISCTYCVKNEVVLQRIKG